MIKCSYIELLTNTYTAVKWTNIIDNINFITFVSVVFPDEEEAVIVTLLTFSLISVTSDCNTSIHSCKDFIPRSSLFFFEIFYWG